MDDSSHNNNNKNNKQKGLHMLHFFGLRNHYIYSYSVKFGDNYKKKKKRASSQKGTYSTLYLHIEIGKFHNIFFQVYNKWAVVADKHNLHHHIVKMHLILAYK